MENNIELVKSNKAELIIKDDFDKQLPQILSNIDMLKEWALRRTEEDRALVLETESDFAYAKSRCATINALIRQIDDKRKEIKKRYTAPVTTFEKSVKELTEILEQTKNVLWEQVKEKEEAEDTEKLEKYKRYYVKKIGSNIFYRPWEMVVDKKWSNKTAKEKIVLEKLDEIVSRTEKDLQTILSIQSKYTIPLLQKYRSGGTIQDVILYNQELLQMDDVNQECVKEEQNTEEQNTEEQVEIVFKVTCSKNQLKILKDFLKNNKISYGRA